MKIGPISFVSTKNANSSKVPFKGTIIPFNTAVKAAESVVPVNQKYLQTIDGKLDWLNWTSKKIKYYCSKKKGQPEKINDFFETVKSDFEDKSNRLFLDDLFAKSPDDAKLYVKNLNRVLYQFQNAGVSYDKCQEVREGIDFIEGVSSYRNAGDLLSHKFEM